MNETIQSLFAEIHIPENHQSPLLEKLSVANHRYLKDLKLNVSSMFKGANLSKKEAALLALATAVNEQNTILQSAFESLAKSEGANAEDVADTVACTSLLSANNVFYRFRHFIKTNDYYNNTPAGLRMSIMMNPLIGKEFFELMSLAISALNGCEMCVGSHEQSVKQHGASEARIYDAIRLVSVIKSLSVLV